MSTYSKEIALVLGVGAAALITATTWYQYNKRRNTIPNKWVEVGSVSELWIYPLKSGGAIEAKELECTELGAILRQDNKLPLKDRGFLVYNKKDGEHRTGRNYPKMVLITLTAINEHEVRLEAPDMSPLIINTSFENPVVVPVVLHYGEPQQCIDCGDEASKWISQYCSKNDSGLGIGYYTDYKRSVTVYPKPKLMKTYKKFTSKDMGIFSDLAGYHIINQASVDDLNQKLPTAVSPLNFRPNCTVKGPKAFAEDDWDWIKIGDEVVLRNVSPCSRCTMVNIDPETGIPVPEQRVLRKLREYRLAKDPKVREFEGIAPMQGLFGGLRKPGQIKLGDKVYVG